MADSSKICATSKPCVVAIILSAGCGSRFSKDKTKQKYEILGKTVLRRTLLAFDKSCVSRIVIVHKADEGDFALAQCEGLSKPYTLCVGGRTRSESARLGFLASGECDTVMIHDGARCLILPSQIDEIARVATLYGAASAACEITDTVKRISDGRIASSVNRSELVTVQTPQAFAYSLYARALEMTDDGEDITDDNMRVERAGATVVPVFIGKNNIKITTPEDIKLCEYILGCTEE